jgi:hypothetical protein
MEPKTSTNKTVFEASFYKHSKIPFRFATPEQNRFFTGLISAPIASMAFIPLQMI